MQSEGKWVNRFPLETCLGGLVGRSTCVRARDKTPFSRINDLTLPISRRTEFLWATESGGRVLRLLPQVATREEGKEEGRGSFNLDSSIEPSHLDETKNKEIPLRSLSLSLSPEEWKIGSKRCSLCEKMISFSFSDWPSISFPSLSCLPCV